MSLEGHNLPCYYCQKLCNALAGNPSEWPIPLCHSDEPGKVKWHHIGCVSNRLSAKSMWKEYALSLQEIVDANCCPESRRMLDAEAALQNAGEI